MASTVDLDLAAKLEGLLDRALVVGLQRVADRGPRPGRKSLRRLDPALLAALADGPDEADLLPRRPRRHALGDFEGGVQGVERAISDDMLQEVRDGPAVQRLGLHPLHRPRAGFLGLDRDADVCDLAQCGLVVAEQILQRGKHTRRHQLIAEGHARHVDQVRVVLRRRGPELDEGLEILLRGMQTQGFRGGAAGIGILVLELLADQVGFKRPLRPLRQGLQEVDADDGIAARQRLDQGLIQRAEALQHPETVRSLEGRP
jgi:hypothetical protein